ncbi:MAG: V-type ATPase subunit [Candidatus Heimdallarchaeaceae archaeon]
MFSGIGYLFGRAHGIIGKVLTKSQISFLLSSSNLKELQAAFHQTQYGYIVRDLNFVTEMPEVSRRLKSYFAEIVNDFYNQGPQEAKEKIRQFSQRYHAENIRYILRGLYMKQTKEEIIKRIFPVAKYSFEYYETLLTKTIPQIIKEQSDPELRRRLEHAYEEFEKTGRFVPVDAAIDQYEYQQLPRISSNYDVYVKMRNILWICRCITLEIPPYRYILPTKFLSKALDKKTISEVLSLYNFPPYKKIFSAYIGKEDVPLHDLEFAVERFLLKTWKQVFRHGSFSDIDVIIAFFELKYAEVSDLIRIIVGINAGFSEEEIRKSLLFYQL